MATNRRALVPHAVLLIINYYTCTTILFPNILTLFFNARFVIKIYYLFSSKLKDEAQCLAQYTGLETLFGH